MAAELMCIAGIKYDAGHGGPVPVNKNVSMRRNERVRIKSGFVREPYRNVCPCSEAERQLGKHANVGGSNYS